MIGIVALSLFIIALVWGYYHDTKERPTVSPWTWVVVLWILVHGSRPLSVWFGIEIRTTRDEGNVVEAWANLILICFALLVLFRRNVKWSVVLKKNKWLVVFYLFWCASIFWSDYPLITSKRLFKDLGNLAMVMIVLSEAEPSEALRAVCVRVAYLCIPLSIILIKYYPQLGRSYVGYQSNISMHIGMANHKNTLGFLVFMSVLFLIWDLLEVWGRRMQPGGMSRVVLRLLVICMCWYLLMTINSVTSLVCSVFGCVVFIVLRYPYLRTRPVRWEVAGLVIAVVVYAADVTFDIQETIFKSLGRNKDFTSRTEIWSVVQEEQVNPFLGMGFDTFWAGDRLEILAEKIGDSGVIQAHNGYLETYLNGGLVGLVLLFIVVISAYVQLRKKVVLFGFAEDHLKVTILLMTLVYNFTEASFNKLSPLWFLTCVAIMEYRSKASPSRGSVASSHRRL